MEPFQRQTFAFDWHSRTEFSDDTSMDIPLSGDVVDKIILRFTWDTTSNVSLSLGTAMINMVELRWGKQVIERLYGENLYIMNDTMVPQGKRAALNQLTGMDTTAALAEYYIPLPFTMKIPLCALEKTCTLRIVFNRSSTFMTIPLYGELKLKMVVEYAFLSHQEKLYMQTHPMIYTVQYYQMLEFIANPNQTNFNVVTSFMNNVKELYWVIQDPTTAPYTFRDDLINLGLTFNGLEYLSPYIGTNIYLSMTQPLQYHTKTPNSNVYMYSFSLNPESPIPTGEVNMSNITNQMHTFVLTPYSGTRYIRIYAHTYNIATVFDGKINVKYTLGESGFKN